MKQITLLLILLCFSCGQIKHSKPLPIITEKNFLDTTKIRFDGFYNTLDTTIIRIQDCENLIKEKNTKKSKTIDNIVFGNNKSNSKKDSIISAVSIKNCKDNGKRYSDVFTSNNLVVFDRNGQIYKDYGSNRDQIPYECSYYKMIVDWHKEHKEEIFGKYTIKNDSIYAYLPVTLKTWGMISRTVKCNYRGYVKNKDTIVDWKIISPYPKGTSKFVRKNNKNLFEPHTLYFVKTDAVKCLEMD